MISGALKSTFIVLIPKIGASKTFGDFRPISLRNILYKLISKIITERLKVTLSIHITPKKFGFLKGRSIHDAVAISEECIHSAHTEKRTSMVTMSSAACRQEWNVNGVTNPSRLSEKSCGFHDVCCGAPMSVCRSTWPLWYIPPQPH